MTKRKDPSELVPSVWTEEVGARAVVLWGTGLPAKEIARQLGEKFTKNMVIAYANRRRKDFPARKPSAPIDGSTQGVNLDAIAKLWNGTILTSDQIGSPLGLKGIAIRRLAAKHPEKFKRRSIGRPAAPKERKPEKPAKATAPKVQVDPPLPMVVYRGPGLDEYEQAMLPGVTMAENTGCKYALNEGGPFVFCGCERYELKPYCKYHVIKCRGVGTKSERSAGKFDRKVA